MTLKNDYMETRSHGQTCSICCLVTTVKISILCAKTIFWMLCCRLNKYGKLILLRSNKTIYTGVHPTPLANNYAPATIELPSTQIEINDDDDIEMMNGNKDGGDENIESYKSPAQLADLLVTLSTVPESRWRSLTCLDLIKQRNKPKQPPKKPKAAPFFLPTVAGLETKFQVDAIDENADKVDV